ncbi:MAG: methyltransferase domain-containing protein [Alphaproteobacteria bacterium]|nr:methyltransferase domain-containing protein [Alphaproteobacteria bacterium]MCB9792407.1 methyltransferase domain-containing protein [Alphaproteobacteria bacterium]
MPEFGKWDRIYSQRRAEDARPPEALVEHAHLLPTQGRALDLACGMGGAAIFLARRGLEVRAWDASAVAINKLQDYAEAEGLSLEAEQVDLETRPLPEQAFDLIVVAHFLLRDRCGDIARALKPGGLLVYQAHSLEGLPGTRHKNPDYCLRRGELLQLFHGLTPVAWREDALLGDLTQGRRGSCSLVAQATPPEPAFFAEWRRRLGPDAAPDALSRAVALHRPRVKQLGDRLAHLVSEDPADRAHEWGLIETPQAVVVPDSCPPELAMRALIVLKGDALLPSDLPEQALLALGGLVEAVSAALVEATGAAACRSWSPHPDDRRSRRVYVHVDSGVEAGSPEEKRAMWAQVEAALRAPPA